CSGARTSTSSWWAARPTATGASWAPTTRRPCRSTTGGDRLSGPDGLLAESRISDDGPASEHQERGMCAALLLVRPRDMTRPAARHAACTAASDQPCVFPAWRHRWPRWRNIQTSCTRRRWVETAVDMRAPYNCFVLPTLRDGRATL